MPQAPDIPNPPAKAPQVRPVFVGGSGRSGTTIVGRLIGSHPCYAGLPFELRVHLLTGLVGRPGRPMDWMREAALERHETHLHRIIEEDAYAEALDRFDSDRQTLSPEEAARNFIEAIMGPVAEQEGKPAWVEMTPLNAMSGSWLHAVFPEMGLVHMLRDGRDVAASVIATWGGKTLPEALDWWEMRIGQIARDFVKLPEESVITIALERLARDDRDASYERLLDFLGIEDDPAMRAFFDQQLAPTRSNIGRWQRDLRRAERIAITQQYVEILTSLREQGITWTPSPDAVEREGSNSSAGPPGASTGNGGPPDKPPTPSFLIIGAQKSASRWLRINLGKHPDVYAYEGFPHFFSNDIRYRRGIRWYRTWFEVGWEGEPFVGEGSPTYMLWSSDPAQVAGRIQETLPEVKLLAIVRDPVDRAYSAFLHHMMRGRIPPSADLLELVRSEEPESEGLQLVLGGRYGASLEPYFERFGDQLKVILHDDVKADSGKAYRDALEHIGADSSFEPETLRQMIYSRNPPSTSPYIGEDGRRRPLTADERQELYAYFAEDVDAFEKMLGRDLSIWRPDS